MKKATTLFADGEHRWIIVARDPSRPNHLIDTNEYLVCHGADSLICDPGGIEIFPMVFSALSGQVDPRRIRTLFASHQDPDIASSLAMWLDFNPEMKCAVSWLWAGFLPHFGGTASTFISIPDEGLTLSLGPLKLQALPAHYLHSSGNFHLYDEKARLLFSGDVGAALLPPDAPVVVKDFDEHIEKARGFHQRWMGSNEAKLDWCERVARLQLDFLCPQHGAVYQGQDVQRFINWFAELEVGTAIRRSPRAARAA
jgi:flavorubredoxin